MTYTKGMSFFPFIVYLLSIENHQCAYHTRHPTATGENENNRYATAALVNHGKRRKENGQDDT